MRIGIRYHYKILGMRGVIGVLKKKLGCPDVLIKIERKDIKNPFYLRPCTSDAEIFNQVFGRREYDFDASPPPEIIIDAGANIGLASICFANRFPDAKIIAIEPEQSNFSLLRKNAAPYKNVIPLRAALWNKNEEICVVDSGLGQWGFMTEEKMVHGQHQDNFCHYIKGKTVDGIMRDYHLQKVDILKVDIEGAEKEVFSDTSSWIEKVDAMIIELHDRMKAGCTDSFYNGSKGFDDKWQLGENIYLSRKKRLTRRPA